MEEFKEKIKTKFFKDGKFIIIIVETEDYLEAHLTRQNYGNTNLMFALPKKEVPDEQFEEIVETNLAIYEKIYLEEMLEKEGIE